MPKKSLVDAQQKLSHPDKVYWPEEGYTKSDLANFYRKVFPLLAPYVKDRILTLERCPNGMTGQCFYQKEMPQSMPPGTPTKEIANDSGPRKSTHYVVGGSLTTQLALVNLGCIPVHVMGSRAATFPNPDWICIDLDPGSGKFGDAATAGLCVKEVLDELDLISFPKTSGSRGLHIFIPIRVGPPATDVLKFAEQLLAKVAADHPKQLTVEHSIAARGNRVYLDALRNGSVQTVVSPYSVRRKAHAPVSTPLNWSEVTTSLDPAKFNIGNFAARMKKKDPWVDFFKGRQPFQKLGDKLKKI
ncbi:MAG TPA: non-homologous end-joining DNA ligase [Candidatus Acidoferrales bacterium]|jgi:bifunctional non-homologous end joining protein LigD|nr:non-homologous end-joining DNA ligase [Candidatus Acidoferrales bacterium]